MKISPNQYTIMEALIEGPEYIRHFHTVRPLLLSLIDAGLIERCAPRTQNRHHRNMVRLTAAGCAAVEVDPKSVPAERVKVAPPPKAKLVLGKMKDGLAHEVRLRCEAFLRAFSKGEEPGTIVGQLAEQRGVTKPSIWRSLRSGGLLPPYQSRDAKRTAQEQHLPPLPRSSPAAVSRDGCPRCGVRGDIGCKHSRERLGVSFG